MENIFALEPLWIKDVYLKPIYHYNHRVTGSEIFFQHIS